jgi:hypothetical protein
LHVFQWRESIAKDIVMYDFTLNTGDLFFPEELATYWPYYTLKSIDYVLLGNEEKRSFCLSADFSSLTYYWIEGMGSTRRFLETRERLIYESIYGTDWNNTYISDEGVCEKKLVYFYKDNEVLWSHPNYPKGLTSNNASIKTLSVSLFPNPMENNSLIVSSSPLKQIQIFDVKGILLSNDKADGKFQFSIYKKSLNAGIYYVKVTLQNGLCETKCLIIK